MYRHFGGQGRGNLPHTSAASGSNSVSQAGSGSSTTQLGQKYAMAGSGEFVPSLNAITTNQDLQWLVQPSLMHSPGPSRSPVPYSSHLGARALGPPLSQSHHHRPGVIKAAATTTHSTRRRNDEQLSMEELERRRLRRERNKMAAAKCRNRRRELTDSLQNETEQLEDEKSRLQKEIAELQKQKEKLELVLEAHRPICKIDDSDSDSDTAPPVSSLGNIKIEPEELSIPGPSSKLPAKVEKPKPKITITTRPVISTVSMAATESESLHTPVLTTTPSLLSFAPNMIFTYPIGSSEPSSSTSSFAPFHQGNVQQGVREPCGIAHRRSSSSGDQSDHSLHSPTILTL